MGVGWWQYQGAISAYTQQILRHCLHPSLYHSVRDSYTKEKLSSIGINNVLMTGCPTLWSLTEDHCRRIRRGKSENVLLTFTNYSQDKSDLELFNIVQSKYKNIYVWVQGPEDLDYAKQFSDKIHILPPRLDSLDELLASDIELDYIGTRCHAGIRAMQHLRRTIIIGVDNRAIEMQKDFNLPVLARANLSALPKAIDCEFETRLNLPFDTIGRWCRQFSENFNLHADIPGRPTRQRTVVKPVSRQFGLDRGTPIDRYYIEKFLKDNESLIQGRVLEIGDNAYTKKYGRNITQSDVLNAVPGGGVTIVGDLATGLNIPRSAFDCIILTQTIQCIYDVKSALKHAIGALKPGGTLLLTASGISQISRYDMDRWGEYWRFTDKSLKMLLTEILPDGLMDVRPHGNVAVAKAFLDGLAFDELDRQALDYQDDDYQVVLTAKLQKAAVPYNANPGICETTRGLVTY
jgi:SAM-dependent methyltransferase